MVRIEATLFKCEGIRFCPRREREKPHEELMIAGLFPLLQQWLGVIGVFHILEPIVPAGMAGNEFVAQIDTQAVWVGFERQGVAGIVSRDRVAVGLQGNTKLPGGSDL